MKAETFQVVPGRDLAQDDLGTSTDYSTPSRTITTQSPDVSTDELMALIEASGALDFWLAPGEDIYTDQDGDAL